MSEFQWGKINGNASYGKLTYDLEHALTAASLTKHQRYLVDTLRRQGWARVRPSKNDPWPDPEPVKFSMTKLANETGWPRSHFYSGLTALIQSRIFLQSSDGYILNKQIDQWVSANDPEKSLLTETDLLNCKRLAGYRQGSSEPRVRDKSAPSSGQSGENLESRPESGTQRAPNPGQAAPRVRDKSAPSSGQSGENLESRPESGTQRAPNPGQAAPRVRDKSAPSSGQSGDSIFQSQTPEIIMTYDDSLAYARQKQVREELREDNNSLFSSLKSPAREPLQLPITDACTQQEGVAEDFEVTLEATSSQADDEKSRMPAVEIVTHAGTCRPAVEKLIPSGSMPDEHLELCELAWSVLREDFGLLYADFVYAWDSSRKSVGGRGSFQTRWFEMGPDAPYVVRECLHMASRGFASEAAKGRGFGHPPRLPAFVSYMEKVYRSKGAEIRAHRVEAEKRKSKPITTGRPSGFVDSQSLKRLMAEEKRRTAEMAT